MISKRSTMNKLFSPNKKNDRRLTLKANFEDHCRFIESNDRLKESIKNSIDKSLIMRYVIVVEDEYREDYKDGNVSVVNMRTMEAARIFGKDKKVAVLNFASARNPGGMVKEGSSAQEESLCRCSTLYQVLSDKSLRGYYDTYKEVTNFMPYYTDKLIYSPDICIFGTDTYISTIMPEHLWYNCDVITCAAPNMLHIVRAGEEIDKDKLCEVLVSRIINIVNSAIANKADVLVLGAFGCGVFKNPPDLVAKAFRKVLIDDNMKKYFDDVVFAIIDDNRGNGNLDTFATVLGNKSKEV